MTRKRVLVTGGAGFIPSNFVRHILESTPYEVVSLDALTYAGNLDNLDGAMSHERLSFVQGDIRDVELVRDIVAEVDVIVNAAAESHVEKSIAEGAREFVTTNVEGTQILLDAIREAPVERFILFSSSRRAVPPGPKRYQNVLLIERRTVLLPASYVPPVGLVKQ